MLLPSSIRCRSSTLYKTLQFRSTEPGKLSSPSFVQAVCDGNNNDIDLQPRELRLHIFDRSTNIKFLIDSGSIVSVLPKRLVFSPNTVSTSKLCAANDTPIKTYGDKILQLDLGLRRAFKCHRVFIVADVTSAIIGADFLVHYDHIDLKNKRLIDNTTSLTTRGEILPAHVCGISTIHSNLDFNGILNEYVSITQEHKVRQTDARCALFHIAFSPRDNRPPKDLESCRVKNTRSLMSKFNFFSTTESSGRQAVQSDSSGSQKIKWMANVRRLS